MSRWDVVTVSRVIPAAPEEIFALIADPARHRDIDGSGTVRSATDVPAQLCLGATFGMDMQFGPSYSMVNTVIEYEPNRRLAWQARPPVFTRHFFGGRIWRYVLEPVADGTRVSETWDISQEKNKVLVRPYRVKARRDMTATLERIEHLLAGENTAEKRGETPRTAPDPAPDPAPGMNAG